MKVSVAMITYNHEKFIAQAIESVLMQETNFDYELIIGEDCSTDSTAAIVADYHQRYPDKIRATVREKNIGARDNSIDVFRSCNGDYIALCEGDDYWTTPYKLQKQVDYLDAHSECSICFTRAGVFYDGAEDDIYHKYWPIIEPREITGFADLIIDGVYLPTCATVYRNHLFPEFPEWFHTVPQGDWPLHLLNAQHGYIYYISEVMAAYRKHPGGMSSGWSDTKNIRNRLKILESLAPSLEAHYRGIVRTEMGRMCYKLILHDEEVGDIRDARANALYRITLHHFEGGLENPVRQVLRLYMPGLHRFLRTCKKAVCGKM